MVRGWRLFAAFLVVLLGGAVFVPAAAASAVNPPPGAVLAPAAPGAVGAPVALDPYDPKNFKVLPILYQDLSIPT